MSTGTYRKSKGSKLSPAKAQELRDARVAELKSLRESLEQFEATSDPATIAATLALHDGYSPRNAMLIAMQKPTATDVAGFGEWKERGRHVRKGEHGIRIMAPAGTYAVKGKDEAPAGAAEGKDKEFMRFRAVSVFDISQTDPISASTAADANAAEEADMGMVLL
jgi:antirestriction protein ArdC